MSATFRDILTKQKYKEGTKQYKDYIKQNNAQQIQKIHQEILTILEDDEVEPYTLLYAARLLKDCVQIGNPQFLSLCQEQGKGIIFVIQEILMEQEGEKYENYGKSMFGDQPTEEEQRVGKSLTFLLLECVYIWAIWFQVDDKSKQVSAFAQVYNNLKNSKIEFPVESAMTYFKPEDKNKFQGGKPVQTSTIQQQPQQQVQQQGQQGGEEDDYEDEQTMFVKLEDFENLKEEVRKHLDNNIKDKTPKISTYFKDFQVYFSKAALPTDPNLKKLAIHDKDICQQVLTQIVQLTNGKLAVPKFIKQIKPLMQPIDENLMQLIRDSQEDDDIQQLQNENDVLKEKLQNSQIQFEKINTQYQAQKKKQLQQTEEITELQLKLDTYQNDEATYKQKIALLEKKVKDSTSQKQNLEKDTYEIDALKLDLENIKQDLQKANKTVNNKQKEINQLQSDKQQLEQTVLNLEEEEKTIKRDMFKSTKVKEQQLQQDLDSQKTQLKTVQLRLQEKTKELNDANQQIFDLENQITIFKKENKLLQKEVKNLKDQLDEYEENKLKDKQDIEEIRQEYLRKLNQEIQENKEALEKTNLYNADVQIQLEQQKFLNGEQQDTIKKLERQIENLKKQKSENNETKNETAKDEEINALLEQNIKLEEEIDENKQKLKKLHSKNDELQNECDKYNEESIQQQNEIRKLIARIKELEYETSSNHYQKKSVINEVDNEEEEYEVIAPNKKQQQAQLSSVPSNQQQQFNTVQNNNSKQENQELVERLKQMEKNYQNLVKEMKFQNSIKEKQFNASAGFQMQTMPNQDRLNLQQQPLQQSFYAPTQLQRPQSQDQGFHNKNAIKLSQYIASPQKNGGINSQSTYFPSNSKKNLGQTIQPESFKMVILDKDKFNFTGFKDKNQIIKFQKSCLKLKYPIYSNEKELVVGLRVSETQQQQDCVSFQIYFTNKGQNDIFNLSFLMPEINIPQQALSTSKLEVDSQKKMDIIIDFKGDQKIIWGNLQYSVENRIIREKIALPNTMYHFLQVNETRAPLFLEKWEQCKNNIQQTYPQDIETEVVANVTGIKSKLKLINLNEGKMNLTTGPGGFQQQIRNQQNGILSFGGLFYLKKTNTKILLKVEGKEKNAIFSACFIPTNDQESLYHSFIIENLLQTLIMIFSKQNP